MAASFRSPILSPILSWGERAAVARGRVAHVAGDLLRDALRRVARQARRHGRAVRRSEEPTSELPSLLRTSYDVFCLKQPNDPTHHLCCPGHTTTQLLTTNNN